MTSLFKQLSIKLKMNEHALKQFIATSPNRYKVYEIPKRNGKGNRTIAQPAKAVKLIQREMLKLLEPVIIPHSAATAYENGSSIKQNASKHVHNSFILKMDFEDFFPSIKPVDFLQRLTREKIGYELDDHELSLLGQLFFWRPKRGEDLCLSIGAPSSPKISNYVMKDFDDRVHSLCEANGIAYTRYADDLCFSTADKGILRELENDLHTLVVNLDSPKLRINRAKTVHSSKKHNRHVTGLTLTNDGVISLGRDRKRLISAMVYRYLIAKTLLEEDVPRLRGLLNFAADVEPQFLERLCKKYKIKGPISSIF